MAVHTVRFVSDTKISEINLTVCTELYSKEYALDTFPVFFIISAPDFSSYWYLIVKFLGTENLLWNTSRNFDSEITRVDCIFDLHFFILSVSLYE